MVSSVNLTVGIKQTQTKLSLYHKVTQICTLYTKRNQELLAGTDSPMMNNKILSRNN